LCWPIYLEGKMQNELDQFMAEKKLADPMKSAFVAYCKSLYSSRYLMRSSGDTIKLFLDRMSREQVDQAWNDFVSDIRNILPTILS
jgi:hypothetical protein